MKKIQGISKHVIDSENHPLDWIPLIIIDWQHPLGAVFSPNGQVCDAPALALALVSLSQSYYDVGCSQEGFSAWWYRKPPVQVKINRTITTKNPQQRTRRETSPDCFSVFFSSVLVIQPAFSFHNNSAVIGYNMAELMACLEWMGGTLYKQWNYASLLACAEAIEKRVATCDGLTKGSFCWGRLNVRPLFLFILLGPKGWIQKCHMKG